MYQGIIRAVSIAAMALAFSVGSAAADPHKNESGKHGWKEKHRDEHKGRGHGRDDDHDRRYYEVRERDVTRVYIDRPHRDVIVRYYGEHGYSCPPGLVKTRSGCIPKGHAKKRYVIGRPLPSTVIVEPLPRDLVVMLPPPPSGYIYRRVDGDVLLVAEATKKVLDAVVLMSAL